MSFEKEARDKAEDLIAKSVGRVTSLQTIQLVRRILRFYHEDLDMNRFETVGVIKNQPVFDEAKLMNSWLELIL